MGSDGPDTQPEGSMPDVGCIWEITNKYIYLMFLFKGTILFHKYYPLKMHKNISYIVNLLQALRYLVSPIQTQVPCRKRKMRSRYLIQSKQKVTPLSS
jgi:hypothetical protein